MSTQPEALTEGELWSLFRSIMSQGADIRVDYEMGVHKGREAYRARLDAAAAERQQEFWAARIQPLHAEIERLTADHAALLETCRLQTAEIRALGEQVTALTAALDAAQADAKRYRWLRDNDPGDWAICKSDVGDFEYCRDCRAAHIVDAAIDAAIAAERQK